MLPTEPRAHPSTDMTSFSWGRRAIYRIPRRSPGGSCARSMSSLRRRNRSPTMLLYRAPDLMDQSAVGWWDEAITPKWHLASTTGEHREITVRPRLVTNNLLVARDAALTGLGMTRLPKVMCDNHIRAGRLTRVLDELVLPPRVSVLRRLQVAPVAPAGGSKISRGSAFISTSPIRDGLNRRGLSTEYLRQVDASICAAARRIGCRIPA